MELSQGKSWPRGDDLFFVVQYKDSSRQDLDRKGLSQILEGNLLIRVYSYRDTMLRLRASHRYVKYVKQGSL